MNHEVHEAAEFFMQVSSPIQRRLEWASSGFFARSATLSRGHQNSAPGETGWGGFVRFVVQSSFVRTSSVTRLNFRDAFFGKNQPLCECANLRNINARTRETGPPKMVNQAPSLPPATPCVAARQLHMRSETAASMPRWVERHGLEEKD